MASRSWEGNDQLRRLLVPLDDLDPHPLNARVHALPSIVESLRSFGQQRPILIVPAGRVGDRQTIVAGHGTTLAAREAGWTHVAAITSDLTDDDIARYVAADNRTSDLGSYDDSKLATLLSALPSLDGTGYEDGDLAKLLSDVARRESTRDPDAVPDAPVAAVSLPGGVYDLGRHRLVCGDARDPGAYGALLDGAQADLVWTDPPYGVDVTGRTAQKLKIQNDALDLVGLRELLLTSLTAAYAVCRDGANWYVAAPSSVGVGDVFFDVLGELGVRKHVLVWVKQTMVLTRLDYHTRHEFIHYGWKPGSGRVRPSDRTLTSVLEVDRPARNTSHPTMKPVELVEIAVEHSSRPGDLVLDPFGGSGTTLIACERQGRSARLIELDPAYCDVIRQRYADYAGRPDLAP